MGKWASTLLGVFERSHMLVSAPMQAVGLVSSNITKAVLELAIGLQGPQHLHHSVPLLYTRTHTSKL